MTSAEGSQPVQPLVPVRGQAKRLALAAILKEAGPGPCRTRDPRSCSAAYTQGGTASALVTHKHGDKEPGPGLYEMARHLGFRFREPSVFWS